MAVVFGGRRSRTLYIIFFVLITDSNDEEDPGDNDDKPGDSSKGGIGDAYKKAGNFIRSEYNQLSW